MSTESGGECQSVGKFYAPRSHPAGWFVGHCCLVISSAPNMLRPLVCARNDCMHAVEIQALS